MKKTTLLLLTINCLFGLRLGGQTDDCLGLNFPSQSAQTGEIVCFPLKTNGFDDILTMQFSIHWNPDVLQFEEIQSANWTGLNIPNNFGFSNAANGTLSFAWFDSSLNGVALADETTLFNLCFTVIGQAGATSQVFVNSVPTPVEFINSQSEIISPNFVQGQFTVGNPPSGSPFSLTGCVKNMTCSAPTGEIDVTISGGHPPFSFDWKGPGLFTSTSEDLTGLLPGLYLVTALDGDGVKQKGSFLIENTAQNPFSIQLFSEPASCTSGFSDGKMHLETTGGEPPFSILWSNGAETDSIEYLAAGDFSVTVTDAGGCAQIAADSTGQTSGLVLEAAVTMPDCLAADTLGEVQLTVSGGLTPFIFEWSNGLAGAFNDHLPLGNYQFTATDASGCSTVAEAEIRFAPFANWAFNFATICNPDSTTGSLEFHLLAAPGATMPLTFLWETGFSEIVDSTGGNFLESTLTDSPSAFYDLSITDSKGCELVVNDLFLSCQKPPNAVQSCLIFRAENQFTVPAQPVCVPVSVDNFVGIASLIYHVRWDTSKLQYLQLNPSTVLENVDFYWNPAAPEAMSVLWLANPFEAKTLPDNTFLYDICFEPKGQPGETTTVEFFERPNFSPIDITDTQPIHFGFNSQHALISFENALPPLLTLNACSTVADCANNGKGSIDLSVSGGATPYIYEWAGPGGFAANSQDLPLLEPGIYELTVTDAAGTTATGLFKIHQINQPFQACVWPGDADKNGAANHFDLLTLGLGFGNDGPPRFSTGVDWTGQPASPWAQETPFSQVNFRHLDADGNGSISFPDVAAIEQNWGETILPNNGSGNPQFVDSQGVNPTGGAVPIFISADTLQAGQAAELVINVGTPGQPTVDLHGLAFSVFYDAAIVVPGSVHFAIAETWMGEPGSDLVFIEKDFPDLGRLDVAISRIDGQPVSGSGEVGVAYIVIEDDIYFRGDDPFRGNDTIIETHFPTDFQLAIDPLEKRLDLFAKNLPIFIKAEIISTDSPIGLAKKISLFPNPAGDRIELSASLELEKATLFSPDGRPIFEQKIAARTASISTADLPAGLYFLKIQTEKGLASKRFLKL